MSSTHLFKSKQCLFDAIIAGLDALKNLIDPATQNVLGVDRPLLKVCYAPFDFKYLLKVKPLTSEFRVRTEC